MEWAAVRSLRKGEKQYDQYSVLSVDINSDNIWDLRDGDEIKMFNQLRNEVESKERKKFADHKGNAADKIMINFIQDELNFDGIVCNLFIRNRLQTALGISSRIPNTTVLAVRNVGIIDMTTLDEVKTGEC